MHILNEPEKLVELVERENKNKIGDLLQKPSELWQYLEIILRIKAKKTDIK